MRLGSRQYFFCKNNNAEIHENKSLSFKGYQLYYGEGLDIEHIHDDAISLLLIGYMLDPSSTRSTNKDILYKIKDKLHDGQSIFESTFEYGGRWILISHLKNEIVIFNDTCGLRQVFYSFKNDSITLASQENILSNFLALEKDNEAVEYINKSKNVFKEFSWPLDACEHKEINRLLPNHCIRVYKMEAERFWPDKSRETSTKKDVVAYSASMMRNMMKAAYNRYKVAVTLTAGLDTRLLLAMGKENLKNIKFVTQLYSGKNEFIEDVVIPRKLCNELNLSHTLIKCENNMTPSFERIFYENYEHGHSYWGPMFESIKNSQLEDYLWIKGSCCEIARNPFGLIENKHITVKLLCDLFDITYNDFSIKYINKWINEISDICQMYNYYIIDLFYWEHRMGSWQAMCQNEADIVQETFTPFNTRALIIKLLEASDSYRIAPDYTLFYDIIRILFHRSLLFPINPKRNKSFLRRQLMKIKSRYPITFLKIREILRVL